MMSETPTAVERDPADVAAYEAALATAIKEWDEAKAAHEKATAQLRLLRWVIHGACGLLGRPVDDKYQFMMHEVKHGNSRPGHSGRPR